MPRTPPDDDAALRWDDVDDPSWVEAQSMASQGGAEADSDDVGEHEEHYPGSPEPSRGALTMTLVTAVGAVLYLAYSIAWIVGVGSLPLSGPTLVLEVLYQFAEFLAIVASALWFVVTLVLTAGRVGRRAGWLALGSLVLLPWPFVLGVLA
jgi:hypothetical protein